MSTADQFMQLALDEARKGLGLVHPNPPVGCVIVSEKGEVLSLGHHTHFGGPHAEIDALSKIKDEDLLKGAHVYVTLEPCAHEGKTGSCAKKLASLPIGEVTYALKDPNPLVSGRGAEILEQAGIRTHVFQSENITLIEDLLDLPEIFLKNMTAKETFFSLKLASSLDGKIALGSGESSWITNAESREYVHQLRSQHHAVLVGGRTLLADNPKLNIRLSDQAEKSNKVIVYDPKASALKKITADWNIFKGRSQQDIVWLVNEPETLRVDIPVTIMKLNWQSLAQDLYKMKIESVFVEGGAHVASEFLKHDLVDRFHLFMAPFIIGKSGYAWSETSLLEDMKSRKDFSRLRLKSFGNDAYLSMRYGSSSRLKSNS